MNESFDVIVVGARCAGAPLATMLAREGLRVCLVADREAVYEAGLRAWPKLHAG